MELRINHENFDTNMAYSRQQVYSFTPNFTLIDFSVTDTKLKLITKTDHQFNT